jgi:hypothetical protein
MSTRLKGQMLLVGAIGAILASLLIVVLPGPQGLTGPGSIPTNLVAFLSGVLLLAGLPALYRTQANQIGIVGFVGVVLLEIAIVLTSLVLTGIQVLDVAVPGAIPHVDGDGPPPLAIIPAILGAILILIGGAIVGIMTIRARVFAAGTGWLITISSVLVLLTAPLDGVLGVILTNSALVLLYAGLAWAGATLSFQRKVAPVAASR